MNILHLSLQTNLETQDASYIHSILVAKKLVENINNVHLFIGGKKHKILKVNNIKLEIIKFKQYVDVSGFLRKLVIITGNNIRILTSALKYKNFEVIYERYGTGLIAGLILSKFKNTPLIYEVNGVMDEELFIILKLRNNYIRNIISTFMKMQLNSANGIIVQTEELKKIIQSKCSNPNIYVVNNGVELLNEKISNINDSITRITYVGTIDDLHNLDIVFKSLNSTKLKFVFNVVGGGSQLEHYKKQYIGEKRFVFHNFKDHGKALELIRRSDMCIASYTHDYPLFKKYGFYLCPLKLLEYSAAGKPTIIFGLSNSFTKVFEEGNACIVVNSKVDLINELGLLVINKKLMRKMGKDAKKSAELFTWEKAAKKTEEVLNHAINTN